MLQYSLKRLVIVMTGFSLVCGLLRWAVGPRGGEIFVGVLVILGCLVALIAILALFGWLALAVLGLLDLRNQTDEEDE